MLHIQMLHVMLRLPVRTAYHFICASIHQALLCSGHQYMHASDMLMQAAQVGAGVLTVGARTNVCLQFAQTVNH